MNTDIIFDKEGCTKINCPNLIKYGVCKVKGELPILFECRRQELAEYREEAGLGA